MLSLLVLAACNRECGEDRGCEVHLGRYFGFAPEAWNGEDPLPVWIHAHGMGGSPGQYFEDEAVMAEASAQGVLALFPEGQSANPDWDKHIGDERDEVEFTHEMLDDAAEHWVIDDDRVYATGFSVGAILAGLLACESDRVAAVGEMSGGLTEPWPEVCPAPTVPLFRTHGTADTTWPIEGQDFGEWQQAPLDDEMAFWRERNGCSDEVTATTEGALACQTWACEDEVRLCLHDEGHTRLDGWVESELSWLQQYAR